MIKMKVSKDRAREAEKRARIYMWSSGYKVRVVHPKFGEIVVPHRSNLAAIQCAAEVWGVDWTEIRDAEIRSVSQAN